MVTLGEAKRYLGVVDNSNDAELERLIQAAVGYLTQIGVPTETPVAEPIRQAGLLLIAQFRRDFFLRTETVEGLGSTTFNLPTETNEATDRLVRALIAPYREVVL